jgi:hypothetical protein
MCRTSRKLVNFLPWEQGPFNNIVYKSKTSNMLLEIRERGPFNNIVYKSKTSNMLLEIRERGPFS